MPNRKLEPKREYVVAKARFGACPNTGIEIRGKRLPGPVARSMMSTISDNQSYIDPCALSLCETGPNVPAGRARLLGPRNAMNKESSCNPWPAVRYACRSWYGQCLDYATAGRRVIEWT